MREIIETDIPRIRKLLLNVLGESDYQHITRMGGLTNRTYKTVLPDGRIYVVRLPGEGTEELINRSNEKVSTQLACHLGIDAQMLFFGERGEKVTCYIEGGQTLCIESFSDESVLRKVAEILHTLHTSGDDTKIPFDVFDMAAEYEKIINDNLVPLFDDYAETKGKIMAIRNCINVYGDKLVPCHNDPLCENWVMSEEGKLYLIDWEYAGMNDAMWDLADISIEASFSEVQDKALLNFYFGRVPTKGENIRFYANKLYLDFLWALWGKARVPFDGASMEEYGQERYARLKRNLVAFTLLHSIDE